MPRGAGGGASATVLGHPRRRGGTVGGVVAALGAIAGHGVRLASVGAGSVVAVVGLGLVGQIAAQLATAAGARVVGIDADPARVELVAALGAVAGPA